VNNWPVLENAHTPTWCAEPSECGRSALVLSVRSDDNDGAAAPEDVALHAGHIRREGNVVRVFFVGLSPPRPPIDEGFH
jgi:hypothetical protein